MHVVFDIHKIYSGKRIADRQDERASIVRDWSPFAHPGTFLIQSACVRMSIIARALGRATHAMKHGRVLRFRSLVDCGAILVPEIVKSLVKRVGTSIFIKQNT